MNKKYKLTLIISSIILLIIIISLICYLKQTPTIDSEIYGKVTLITGNCMPQTCKDNGLNCYPSDEDCKTSGVSRTVYITKPVTYETLKNDEIDIIQKVQSNNQGIYYIRLPLGTYSILVEDDNEKYCNDFNSLNEVCQVTLGSEIKEYNIEIDHAIY